MSALPIRYHVDLSSPHSHLFTISLIIDSPNPNGQVLSLPAWIPGSYMIRDFARNIVSISAEDKHQNSVAVQWLDKQSWQLSPCEGPVTVTYDVYAFDLSVRSAYVSDEYAFFNGTSMFLKVEGQAESACQVMINKPTASHCSNWVISTGMPSKNKDKHAFGEFEAASYEALIDYPVVMGDLDIIPFTARGVTFDCVFAGKHNADTARIVRDLETICAYQLDFFGQPYPIEHYVFMTLLCSDGFGGLEHKNSTALMYSRGDLPTKHTPEMSEGYRTFLSLCSHEFFHTWNVKRLKPKVLKNATLCEETYTEQLWIYEGFTSYYDDLILYRSGIISRDTYLEIVGQNLTRLLRNGGSLKQTVTNSSFLAWTKFYKQDASAINHIVSYYNKGAVIAMCLDLFIRQQSTNEVTLDALIQHMWQAFGKDELGTEDDVVHRALKEIFNIDADAFLQQCLYTTQPLPTEELLQHVGISITRRAQSNSKDVGGKPAEKVIRNGLGLTSKSHAQGAQVAQIIEGSAAQEAGLQLNDIIIALNNEMVTHDNLQTAIDQCQSGKAVRIHVFRDKRLLPFSLTVKAAPKNTLYLTIEDQNKVKHWLPDA
ncbi:PDZ domain-containing protein [Aestuariibacter sp. AA17]|uniref:PDZ domain-containing protein n=1 Tax=Fluctibacter corallii TaxID=2984329 RepID=A0ABT3AAE3_9ALTE|nr:PDZ domain-containing protein [Aestuariibacter sp. AA17]MCV2885247.1 PDZ domain-containing protein [Aestuariibacter sp. AA17]